MGMFGCLIPFLSRADPLLSIMLLCIAFDHLLNLSLAWHTKKKTGEVLRILDRGSSLNNLFQVRSVHPSILPVVV